MPAPVIPEMVRPKNEDEESLNYHQGDGFPVPGVFIALG